MRNPINSVIVTLMNHPFKLEDVHEVVTEEKSSKTVIHFKAALLLTRSCFDANMQKFTWLDHLYVHKNYGAHLSVAGRVSYKKTESGIIRPKVSYSYPVIRLIDGGADDISQMPSESLEDWLVRKGEIIQTEMPSETLQAIGMLMSHMTVDVKTNVSLLENCGRTKALIASLPEGGAIFGLAGAEAAKLRTAVRGHGKTIFPGEIASENANTINKGSVCFSMDDITRMRIPDNRLLGVLVDNAPKVGPAE